MSGGERLRLFVALELPEEVRETVLAWRSRAAGAARGLRSVASEHLHVTLCFLGWRAAAEVGPIASACRAAISAGRGPAELELGPGIWLPPRRPRVLALEVVDRGQGLAALQSALAGALERGGFYVPEKRPFRPHLTVARVVGSGHAPAPRLADPPALRFPGDRITLYRSRLTPTGARYEVLSRCMIPGR